MMGCNSTLLDICTKLIFPFHPFSKTYILVLKIITETVSSHPSDERDPHNLPGGAQQSQFSEAGQPTVFRSSIGKRTRAD